MPTYHSPASSPSRSLSRTSSFSDTPPPRRQRSTTRHRSPSLSSSSSRSSSRSGHRASRAFKKATSSDTKTESAVKTSLIFLGAVGAATLAAQKFWPKGWVYGEKDEWETKEERKVRRAVREAEEEEDEGDTRRRRRPAGGVRSEERGSSASGSRAGRQRDAYGERDRDDRYQGLGRDVSQPRERRMAYDERIPRQRGVSVGAPLYRREEVIVTEKARAPDRGRSQLSDRSRVPDEALLERQGQADRYTPATHVRGRLDVSAPSTVSSDRRKIAERDEDYYPPLQQRYPAIEPPRLIAGSDRLRSPRYYDDREDERDVVYVRREPAVRGRPYSAAVPDDGRRSRSRFDEGYYR